MQHRFLRSWLPILSLMAASGLSQKAAGQALPATAYPFTTTAGTFTEITGGIAVPTLQADDAVSPVIPLEFSFSYNGKNYTRIKANSNGWISFDTTIAGNSQSYFNNTVTNLNTFRPALFPLWDDLSGAGGTAGYNTTGTAPDRIFTLEYKNWRWSYNATAPVISFQVKLFECDGKIQFIYRPEAGAVTGNGASIGIADATGYLSLNNITDTATASSSVFTTNIFARPEAGRIFQFGPFPDCSTASFPASITTSVSRDTVCSSGDVAFGLTPAMPYVRGRLSYQWQASPNGTSSWTNVGNPILHPDTSISVSATRYFRCLLFCDTTTLIRTSSPRKVYVDKQVLWSTWALPRCGPGTVSLHALAPSGTKIRWYADSLGMQPIGAGNPFPYYVSQTRTVYAAPFTNNTPIVAQRVGTGNLATIGYPSPYNTNARGNKEQYLIRASELQAAGLSAGMIRELGFHVLDIAPGTPDLNQFSISMKATNLPALATWETGLVPVYSSSSYSPVPNTLNKHIFNAPFEWDGVSNIIIETCFSNSAAGGYRTVRCTADLGYNTALSKGSDSATICSDPGAPSVYRYRPAFHIGIQLNCEGPRKALKINILNGPPFAISYPEVVCSGAIARIRVSTPTGIYSPTIWSPVSHLFSDSLATQPYTGGNARTVYFRTATAGQHSISVKTGNPALCTAADTARIWVQPSQATLATQEDTICTGTSITLNLVPDTGYAPGSIQWQQSADGVTYASIAGQNSSRYTTPPLTSSTYFRATISAGNQACHQPVLPVTVLNPQLAAVRDSFRYGPGELILEATALNDAQPRWYTDAAGGAPVSYGNQFTTPYLNTTDTYYVAAGYGRTQPPPTLLAPNPDDWRSNNSGVPYARYIEAIKIQWLIRASEMQALGFSKGYISSLGFQVVSPGDAVENMNFSMGTTADSIMAPPLKTGLQTVFSTPVYQPVTGLNIHALQTPYYWDGVSNIVIEECHYNNRSGNSSTVLTIDHNFEDMELHNQSASPTHCTTPAGFYTFRAYTRPNFHITMQSSCESERIPVRAIIRPAPENQNRPAPASPLLQTQESSEIKLYPNPARGSATLVSNSSKLEWVEVYNVQGQLVHRKHLEQAGNYTLPLTGLASGLYTVKTGTNLGISVLKLEVIR